jgi:F0F1-type ATP synthase delta subunit
MLKGDSVKEIAEQIFSSHSVKQVKEIVRELERLVNLTGVKVYYSGHLDQASKEKIDVWIADKIKGEYTIEYIEDTSLIAGFKIVYKDYVYDTSVLNSFKNEIWK